MLKNDIGSTTSSSTTLLQPLYCQRPVPAYVNSTPSTSTSPSLYYLLLPLLLSLFSNTFNLQNATNTVSYLAPTDIIGHLVWDPT